MNQVYLSGRIGPIVIQSKENEILHVTSVLTVMHTTASGIRKEEQFPISAWRGTGKQLLEQARNGCHMMLQGYLSWKKDRDQNGQLEITVKEFQLSNKVPGTGKKNSFSKSGIETEEESPPMLDDIHCDTAECPSVQENQYRQIEMLGVDYICSQNEKTLVIAIDNVMRHSSNCKLRRIDRISQIENMLQYIKHPVSLPFFRYVYDEEIDFYYLRSRYYNANRGRFINADCIFDGINLFSYCGNDPINSIDSNGKSALALIATGWAAFHAIASVTTSIAAFSIGLSIGKNIKSNQRWRSYDDQYKDAINKSIEDYRVGDALSDAINRAQEKSADQWDPKPNKHHIVAQDAEGAAKAREVLDKAHIPYRTSPANLVSISTQLHQHIHTKMYYDSINSVMTFVDRTNTAIYGENSISTLQSGIYCALYTIKGLIIMADDILWKDQYI